MKQLKASPGSVPATLSIGRLELLMECSMRRSQTRGQRNWPRLRNPIQNIRGQACCGDQLWVRSSPPERRAWLFHSLA
jgi:hypothetical protein